MLLEIIIGVCIFIVILGVGAVVFFNEKEAKDARSRRTTAELNITIGRKEFDSFAAELIAVNAEATRKAGLVPAPPPMKDGRGRDVIPPSRQYATGGSLQTRRDDSYVLAAVSDDFTPSTRTCSSSSSSSYSGSSSSCSGSSSSSSSDSGSSSSSCD